MTEKRTTVPHEHLCRPLYVAGVLRATCAAHWWQQVDRTQAWHEAIAEAKAAS